MVSPHRGYAAADENDEVEIPVAVVHALSLERGRRIVTRQAVFFLFLTLLSRLRFDRLVSAIDYPGSQMIPATNALLSLLVLKLLDKERLSHIDDFNCDEALGLFAGLNFQPMRGKAGPGVLKFFAIKQSCHRSRR